MSGGNKYFFPGVAGQRIIDVSHWLGALITSAEIIGTTGVTPVRALIDEGAALIPAEKYAFCGVTAETGHSADGDDDYGAAGEGRRRPDAEQGPELHSLSFGDCVSSWADAAEVSAATHVTYLDRPVRRVLSLVPEMYDEIWTGAKGFYKVEPVVADGGEVILYAPHIREIATSHPQIHEVGYHCRDYFVKQWDRFSGVHWGVLAHSTHLRGAGTYDAATGEERLRVDVTLATGIPEEVCRAVNLGYRDPATIDVADVRRRPGDPRRAACRRSALPPALTGRLADDEPHRQDQRFAAGLRAVRDGDAVPHAGEAHPVQRRGDRGQRRLHQLVEDDVVDSDHADVRPGRRSRACAGPSSPRWRAGRCTRALRSHPAGRSGVRRRYRPAPWARSDRPAWRPAPERPPPRAGLASGRRPTSWSPALRRSGSAHDRECTGTRRRGGYPGGDRSPRTRPRG